MPTWHLAPSIAQLFAQVNAAYPGRSRLSDGTIGDRAHAARDSDHNPEDDGSVNAGDFTNDPAHGFDSDRFARELAASGDPRTSLIISRSRYWTPRNGWRRYTGTNGHYTHAHVSSSSVRALENSGAKWNIPMLGGTPGYMNVIQQQVTKITGGEKMTDQQFKDLLVWIQAIVEEVAGPKFYRVVEDASEPGDLPKNALVRVTESGYVHINATQWKFIQDLRSIHKKPAYNEQPISQLHMRQLQGMLLNVADMNDAAALAL